MTHNPVVKGSLEGVPYEVLDLTKLSIPGFASGFYYTAGEDQGEPYENVDEGTEINVLEGPYATAEEANKAALDFITLGLFEREPQ